MSGTSGPTNEQTQERTHNGRKSDIVEVEEHAMRPSYVEQNVDTMPAVMRRVEAIMVQMAHDLCPSAP